MGKSKPVSLKRKRGGVKSKKNRLSKIKKSIKSLREKSLNFAILGSNSASIKAKLDSLQHVLEILNFPTCITIQETKLGCKNKIEIDGYQIFEKPRNIHGGGLLTAIKHDLDSFEIEVSNKDIEVLVVQGKLGKENIRIVNAYGPQEDESEDAKFDFWEALKKEVIEAKDANCMVIIQMDANAKLGRTIIPGRMLLDLVES